MQAVSETEPSASGEIRAAAIRLLARREHTRQELQRKLVGRYAAGEVALVIEQLAVERLQSDERFAEQYLAMRVDRGYGPLRIRSEMRERGLDGTLVSIQLDTVDDWYGRLRAAAERKFGSAQAADARERARRARYLEYRGFPASLIRDYLAE